MDFTDEYLKSVYRKDGQLWETIGMITDPAVVIRNVVSGEQRTIVVGCLLYQEFEQLVPRTNKLVKADKEW